MSTEVEKWRIRHFLKTLREYRGTAPTGLITLPIPPGTQIPLVVSKLQHEYGTATNIKSHATTLAVQAAIATTIQKLKLYRQPPENGLIIYAGNAYLNGKERKVCLDVHPIKPVTRKDYFCSNRFDVSHLEEMLEESEVYGFVIMDGNGCLLARVQGSKQTILAGKEVTMPKKHKKGGQSSQRFQRKRLECRDAYVKMTSELCTSCFIEKDKPSVNALILAGSSEFKNDLATYDNFDPRLKPLIWKVVDISYGGKSGLDQAIVAVQKDIAVLPLVKEKLLIQHFFLRVRNAERVVVGPAETLSALEAGVVEELLIDENSQLPYQSGEQSEPTLLTEYLSDNYESLGCQVHYITANTSEGVQFIRGFNGLGALLKYDWTYYPPESEETTLTQNQTSQEETGAQETDRVNQEEQDPSKFDLEDFFM